MNLQMYSLVAALIGFTSVFLFFKNLINSGIESIAKTERRKRIDRLVSSSTSLNTRTKSTFRSIDSKVEVYGQNLVRSEYRERLKNLAIQTGGDAEGLFRIVVKQKLYFSIIGLLLSFLFILRGNWEYVILAGLLTSAGYLLPNSVRLVNKFMQSNYLRRLFSMARFAGEKWQSKESLIGLKILTSLFGFIVSYFYAVLNSESPNAILWTLAGVSTGFFLPDVLLYNKVAKRREKFAQNLPDAIDLLSMCVSAGLAFPAALAKVSDVQIGPVPEEFSRVRAEVQLGKDRNDALREMADRIRLDSLRRFVNAVAQVDRFGIPIAAALDEQARELRADRRARAREKAQKVPIKILGPVMLCFLPCVVLIVLGPAVIGILSLT